MVPTLDIIIVNWNARWLLYECLESIEKAERVEFELERVVVVDNASTDGSLSGLEKIDLPLHIIRNSVNRGFAVACNQGAKASRADYLLFLNPDTRLSRDTLVKTVSFMEEPRNQLIGILGVKHIDERGNANVSCARFPTLRVLFGKITGLSKLIPTTFQPHLIPTSELSHSMEVDQVIGAFFLVRKRLFDELKGFDERYFVYFEEVDFSLEAKRRGYTSYYLSDVKVYHKSGGCSEKMKGTRLFYSLRSRLNFAHKHYKPVEYFALLSLTLSVEFMLRLAVALKSLSFSHLSEILKAYKMLLRFLLERDIENEHY